MTKHFEMPVPPRSRGEMIWVSVLTLIVVVFSMLSVYDLVTQEAIIAPLLWICFVALIIWQGARTEGDYLKFAISVAAVFVGKEFVEVTSLGDNSPEIRFCIQIFGRRSNQWSLSSEKLVSVEWSSGQATQMAGRDMNDWHVFIWFNDDKGRKSRKPGQWLHVIGQSRSKQETKKFGLAFVDLLRNAGVSLESDKEECRFTRIAAAA